MTTRNKGDSTGKRVSRAKTLMRGFRERDGQVVARAPASDVFGNLTRDGKAVLIVIGTVDGLKYTTDHNGKVRRYVHDFAAHARPLFAVSHDGRHLYIVGGRFKFTERGIVDARNRG